MHESASLKNSLLCNRYGRAILLQAGSFEENPNAQPLNPKSRYLYFLDLNLHTQNTYRAAQQPPPPPPRPPQTVAPAPPLQGSGVFLSRTGPLQNETSPLRDWRWSHSLDWARGGLRRGG